MGKTLQEEEGAVEATEVLRARVAELEKQKSHLESSNKELLESESRYQQLIDEFVYGVMILDGDSICYANQSLGWLLGVQSPKHLLGRKGSEFLDKAVIDSDFETLSEGESKGRFEVSVRRSDDSCIQCELLLTRTCRNDENLRHLFLKDITESKRAETREQTRMRHITSVHKASNLAIDSQTPQQLAREIYRLVSETMPTDAFVFVEYDAKTDLLHDILLADIVEGERRVWEPHTVRPAFESPLFELLATGEPKLELRASQKISMTGLSRFGEKSRPSASLMFVPMRHKGTDNGIISVQSYEFNAYTESDLALLRDVASVVGMALSKMRAEKALARSQADYLRAVENAHGVPYRFEFEEHGFELMGDGIEKLIGMPAGKLTQDMFRDLIEEVVITDSGAMDLSPQEYRRALETGQIAHYQADYKIRSARGEIKWLSDFAVPVHDENTGELVGALGILQDITERKEGEIALRAASRMEATTTLAGGIAHDFNNLMVGVLGNSELLKLRLQGDPEAEQMVQVISEAARRAGDLAQQLLTFAQGGTSQTKIVDFRKILRETVDLQKHAISPRIQLSLKVSGSLWNVKGDATQLSQIVMNLCINALEAIQGRGQVLIEARNIDADKLLSEGLRDFKQVPYIHLSVKDSGRGMDEETRAKVFEPFFTKKFQGRGLGLAVVYGITRNHEGHITVSSKPGIGTSFNVYLPATKQSAEISILQEKTSPTGNETILVVDDEKTVLDVTGEMLKKLGYRVLSANDGYKAIDLAKNHPEAIHLALLDIGMPEITGSELYPILKDLRPDLKVVICSGYDLDRSPHSLLRESAHGFVQKPFTLTSIAPEIRKILDN